MIIMTYEIHTIKDMLVELEYALLCNDKRHQQELFDLLKQKGIDEDEARIRAMNIYLRGE
jgi:hypothetical protein